MSTNRVQDFLNTPLGPENERVYATAIHASGALGILVPAVAYFVYRTRNATIRAESARAFNLQITFTIFWAAYFLLWSVPFFNLIFAIPLILLFLPALAIQVVLPLYGAAKYWRGEDFAYKIDAPIFR